MWQAATRRLFWQSDGCCTSILSSYIWVCCALKHSPCWIALAYITQLHTHQSVSTAVYVALEFFLKLLFQREAAVERVRRSWANVQTPAYLRCLAVVIITHPHTHRTLWAFTQQSRGTQLWHVQTKYGSQETLHNLNGIQCTEGLSWNLSPRKRE